MRVPHGTHYALKHRIYLELSVPKIHGPPGAIRYEEAENPGPQPRQDRGYAGCGAVAYRDPNQSGFRHALLPSTDGPEDGPDMAHDELVIESVNGTSWGPIARYLMKTVADLLLAQEHHLGPEDIPAAAAFAQRLGWQPIFIPAAPGEGDGWRGGVAAFARRGVRISQPRVGQYEVVEARALAVLAEAPGYRPSTALSVYFEHGKGIGPENLAHLHDIGLFIEAQGEHVPYVIGGDFHCDPDEIARAGFARQTTASIVASRDPRGTCRSTTATSEIDYYIMHNSMTTGLKAVGVVEGAGTTPHVPVQLRFRPRLASARTLVLRQPPRMGLERVFGPIPRPPDWTEVKARAAALVSQVRSDDFVIDGAFREAYAQLDTEWADVAEQDVIAATTNDIEVKKEGLRGRSPVLVWRSVQSERPPQPPAHQITLDKWGTVGSIAHEVRGVLLWLIPNAVTDHWLTMGDNAMQGVPVPGRATEQSTADLLDKLEGIREQLASGTDEDGDDGMQGATSATDEAEDGARNETPILGEAMRLLHALACGTQLAVRAAAASQRSGHQRSSIPPLVARLLAAAERIDQQVQAGIKQAAAHHKAAKREDWRQVLMENIANGAKNAHRDLKLPIEWRPTTSITIDGVVTADPQVLLSNYARKYDDLWNSDYKRRVQQKGRDREVRRMGMWC